MLCTYTQSHTCQKQPQQPHTGVSLKRSRTSVFPFCATLAVDMPVHGDGASGAAKRRRERRLRSWWRHEAQSVQAAVVSALHHSRDVGPAKNEALRGQTTEVEEAGLVTHSRLRAPPPLPPGMRPALLSAVSGPQERVQRHTVEQFGELAPTVQTLDAPVPQSGDQLVETLKNDVEQAIEVPKIFLLDYTHSVPTWCAAAGGTVGGCASSGVDQVDTRQRRNGPRLVPHRCVWGPPRCLLVAVGYSTLPVAPPSRDHRQPRAVYKYWARLMFLRALAPGSHLFDAVLA